MPIPNIQSNTPEQEVEDPIADLLDEEIAEDTRNADADAEEIRRMAQRHTALRGARSAIFTMGNNPEISPSFFDPYNSPPRRQDECYNCGEACLQGVNEQIFTWEDNHNWCAHCYNQNYFECGSCDSIARTRESSRWGCDSEYRYCSSCFQSIEHVECRNCGNYFDLDESEWERGDGSYCVRCVESRRENGERGDSISLRNYRATKELMAEKAGKTLTSLRPIGVELEIEYTSRKGMAKAIREMPKEVGVGTDGSIIGNGLEIRLPPAIGEQAETLITKTCKALQHNGASVNPSCGYHVHLDIADFGEMESEKQLKALKALWCIYLAFEDVITSFLPPSRQMNKYCKSIKSEYSIGEVLNCRNRDDLERMWYRVRTAAQLNSCKADTRHNYTDDQTRYRGINFHTLWKEGHMEVRYHTGTLSAVKILEWANLHASIVDRATKLKMDGYLISLLKNACNTLDLAGKTAMFFNLIQTSEKSQGYYLARQEKFRIEGKKVKETEPFKLGMAILEAEKEI